MLYDINLTDDEVAELEKMLEQEATSTREEIRHTSNREYRLEIKEHAQRVNKLLLRLRGLRSPVVS